MPCPICNRETSAPYKPFCSRRCADVDLGRWLTGGYTIPQSDAGEEEFAPDPFPGGNPPSDKPH